MKKLRIGIIGMGQRTCFHGGCVFVGEEEVQIAGICDNKADRLEYAEKMYREQFGYEVPGYLDYKRMYKDAELDGVFISSPNYIHKEMTIDALESGLPVLCEKPMELTLARSDEMIDAARRTGQLLGLGMQMHYRRRYHKVKEIINSGAIGKVAQIWCTEYRPPYIAMKDWVWDSKKSGGAIHEKNCHHYDIMNMWVQSKPTTVYATGGIIKHFEPWGYKSDIIDNAWILNDYENGAKGMVSICFLATHEQGHYREFGVHGTEGKIFFNTKEKEKINVTYSSGDTEVYDAPGVIRGGLWSDFLTCIRENKEMLVTPEMGRESLLVPMAAEISIQEKRIVHVDELK